MAEYVFEGDVTPYGNTSSLNLPDGRSAGVGEVVELSDGEFEVLSKYFSLASVNEAQVDSPEVTVLDNSVEDSGTVGEVV